MIQVPVDRLEKGIVLAAPIRHPAIPEQVLLQSGYKLDTDTPRRLVQSGIEHVWIRHPGFEFLDDRISDRIPQTRAKLYRSVKESFTGVANRTSGSFDATAYHAVISDMIMAMVAEKNHAIWPNRLIDGDGEIFAHSANVAYLSLVIGMQIQDYVFSQRQHMNYTNAVDLTNLGVGAVLHDLGKLGLEEKWQNVHGVHDDAESDEYRSHAERGYVAVKGRIDATASHILLHHHQRFDGGGFPSTERNNPGQDAQPQEGRDIHIFSRIVAVANTLDALISHHATHNRPAAAALSQLQLPEFRGMFDPVILDAALRAVPPFPLGALVELSDGRQAVVSDLNESSPCQPVVGVLDASSSAAADQERIDVDLSADGAPHIVGIGGRPVDIAPYTLAGNALKGWSHVPSWLSKALRSPAIQCAADERKTARHAWIASATVRFTRDGIARATAVKTLDVNMEGLGFISPKPFHKDEVLSISIQDFPGETLRLRVVHSTAVKQGHHVGCVFAS